MFSEKLRVRVRPPAHSTLVGKIGTIVSHDGLTYLVEFGERIPGAGKLFWFYEDELEAIAIG